MRLTTDTLFIFVSGGRWLTDNAKAGAAAPGH
jgi:hypothetical protein